MSSGRREGGPRPRCPGQTREFFRIRHPVDLVHELKTVEGLLLLVPPRTPRNSGYDVYAHVVFVVICYMSITCICLLYVVDKNLLSTINKILIDKSNQTEFFVREVKDKK
jgi:hypothetical protein